MNSIIIAFAMYSKIPMPKVEWTEKNMKYALCFFPLVGVVIGILYVFIFTIWEFLPCREGLRNSILCILPVFITGGIHVDGFIDTLDARHSYQPIERKLEILKDPHIGAFAMIRTILYFLAVYGFTTEISMESVWMVALGFVYSRALSGLGVVTIKAAKNDGLLVSFSNTAQTSFVRVVMIGYGAACVAGMLYMNLFIGSICAITGIGIFGYYHRMTLKEFGGTTGDLAGYFLQCCELGILLAAIIGQTILKVW